ncbi:MAG TPA: hypothetical protein DCZ94_06410 [Lentisphaeria bacterium]|nr:MAG: hypothetical protein A2X48_05815 [Lentisphaerae bacterium GWF2_49_21]HBC86570.1 hypothetical protein [Lentisphaeria bacterium]
MSLLSEKFIEYIRPPDLFMKLAWLGELGSMGIYVLIAYLAVRNPGYAPNPEASTMLTFIFTALAIIILLFGIIFHALFLSEKAVAKFADGKMPAWMRMIISQGAAGLDKDKLNTLPEDERNFYVYSRSAFKLSLFLYGFMNSCALFGMVLAIITRRPALIFPYVGISAILMLYYFPNLKKLIENAKTIEEYHVD